MTGIVWSQDQRIVTAAPNGPAPVQVTALTANGSATVEPEAVSQNFRVSSLRAPAVTALQPVHKGNPRALSPGASIVQVALQAGGKPLLTPGVYAGVAAAACGDSEYQALQSNLPLAEPALGGGVFDVDGNLLAVVLRCDDRFAAVIVDEVERELGRANSLEGQLLRRYGLKVTGLHDVSRRYFQTEQGALVSEVFDGQPADNAGLAPGDVITSLNETPVRTPEDLRALTTAKGSDGFQVEIRRNQRTVRIGLEPGARRGLVLADTSQGFLFGNDFGASGAGSAPIQVDDRLLMVDGRRPQSLAAARKALSEAEGPVFVVIRRGSRRIGMLIH